MEAPDYIDPKNVKMDYQHDHIDTLLERRSSHDKVEDRRNKLIDTMHSQIMQNAIQYNNVGITEFIEYEDLFVSDTIERFNNGQMDANEAGKFEQLYIKFKQRFNLQEEIVIYDDVTKEELYRLPPSYTPMNTSALQKDHILMDVVQNTSIQHSQISNVLTERKHGEAVYNLARTINDTQNVSLIQRQNNRYHELASKLQVATGKKIEGAVDNPVITNTQPTSTESDTDDLLNSFFE